MRLTINIGKEEQKILESRAKKNYLNLKEQVEDIIRRSCISSKKRSGMKSVKVDDKLVSIFSRERRGRKPKKKKGKKK